MLDSVNSRLEVSVHFRKWFKSSDLFQWQQECTDSIVSVFGEQTVMY